MPETTEAEHQQTTNSEIYKYFGILLTFALLAYHVMIGGYAEVIFLVLNGMLLVVSSEKIATGNSYQKLRVLFSGAISPIARALTVVAAVGGNLIAFDLLVGMNIFPNETVEAIVKRLAVPTLVTFIFFYIFSFFADRISRATYSRQDPLLRKFEFFVHLTATLSTIFLYVLFLGNPLEGSLLSHDEQTVVTEVWSWTEVQIQFLAAVTTSVVIWFIAFLLCYLSRISELVQIEKRKRHHS